MEQYKYIEVRDFCVSHGISTQFIVQLHDTGLIKVVKKENTEYLQYDELPKVEKIVRLHDDLNLNLEGIDVINSLLERVEQMQNEIINLKNKLDFYE